ncbi:MAG: NnrS family protein [Parafilimonas terrae]|nr:NnrS family protein [Parafilimonas terrae]
MAPVQRLRPYGGPPLLSYGFRPFFLLGALYAGLAMPVWMAFFAGQAELPTAFAPRDWHVHEMLYGYVVAAVAGFLLTAVPNWTGRLPLQGRPLLVLVVAWLAGRAAVWMSAWIGWIPAALADLAFLLLLTAAVAREVVSGRNWRNLKVLALLSLLLAGNALFHGEVHWYGIAEYSTRIGIAASLILVMLIGGRIVPSFTRNWLARANPGRMPAPAGRFDTVAMGLGVVALVTWTVAPDYPLTGTLLLAAGLLQIARLARWAGDRTVRDRLVLILHVAYAFVPAGFVLTGLSALGLLPPAAGIHAWTGGAFGAMTLAVMSRASLGHTGRPLAASAGTQAVYALVVLAVLVRICASVHPAWFGSLMPAAGILWSAAFLGFSLTFWTVLTGPRAA